jgi:carbon storage regulator
MLVLSRRQGKSIMIGDDLVVEVVDIRGDRVRIGVKAPPDVPVHRQEVYEAIKREEARVRFGPEGGGLPISPPG